MQNKIILPFIVFMIFVISQAYSKVPDWVKDFDASQKYPVKIYLSGFGVASGNIAEASNIAQESARAEVSKIIVMNIKSMISSIREEKNEQYSQQLSSITQSSTSLQNLKGLQVEKYVEDKESMVYAIAYISKEDLRRIYTKEKQDIVDQIKRITTSAQVDEGNSRNIEAVTKYLSLYPLYENLKEAETILLVVKESISAKEAFNELDKEIQGTQSAESPLMSQAEIANKIDELLSQPMGSIGDVARAMVFRLSKQIGTLDGKIMVIPLTYQDTKMGSSFSRYFRQELENQFAQVAKWKIAEQAKSFIPQSNQITRDLARESGAQLLLTGTYWEQDDKIKLMVNVRDVESGKILAGTDLFFDSSILPGNYSLKPENYESALIAQGAFSQGEIVSSQLQVDVWTNKGNENIIYTSGETMKVYVRVNRESHIRLLYVLADGRWTLLYDDYYIDQSKVNRAVEIPMEFECAPPFGAEMLVAVARTEKFEPLETIEEDGYRFLNKNPTVAPGVATRSLASAVRGEKGMKPKTQVSTTVANQDMLKDLNSNKITDNLRQEFKNNNISISQNATVSTLIANSEWLITDLSNSQSYLIRQENEKLNIFKIQQAEAKAVITTMEQ